MSQRYTAEELPGSEFLGQLNDDTLIYKVDGKYVRDHCAVEWIGGGSGYENEFIDKNEIWVEHELDEEDTEAILVHEISEYLLMRYAGWAYKKAHEMANSVEQIIRRDENMARDEEEREAPGMGKAAYYSHTHEHEHASEGDHEDQHEHSPEGSGEAEGKFGGESSVRLGMKPLGSLRGLPGTHTEPADVAPAVHVLVIPHAGKMRMPGARGKYSEGTLPMILPHSRGKGMAPTMKEFGAGTLHSGSKNGPTVTNRKQAIAIGLSEARKASGKRGK